MLLTPPEVARDKSREWDSGENRRVFLTSLMVFAFLCYFLRVKKKKRKTRVGIKACRGLAVARTSLFMFQNTGLSGEAVSEKTCSSCVS